ncbi:MAG: hypothetical protein ABI646_04775 [Acidobacteriota bacterium]
MSGRKKPVFGTISLVLMVGLVVAAILITVYEPPPTPISTGESFAVAMEAVANIVATLLLIGAVSVSSTILAAISLLRRETPYPAAISLCLAIPSLLIVLLTIVKL